MLFLKKRIGRLRISVLTVLIISFNILFIPSCEQVQNLGILSPARLNDIAGQDGFSTIYITKDTLMWTFGDTLLGSWKNPVSLSTTFEESASASRMIPNTLAITPVPDDSTITDLPFSYNKQNNRVVPFLTNKKDKTAHLNRLWALDGIRIDSTIYFFYAEISPGESNQKEPFRITGSGVFPWQIPAQWNKTDVIRLTERTQLFKGSEPVFGDSVIFYKDHVYILGRKKVDPVSVSLFITRVRPHYIDRREHYEYLTRDGIWSASLHDAGAFYGDVAGEGSLSFNNNIDSFIILYCSLSGVIKSAIFKDFSEVPGKKSAILYQPPPLKKIQNRPLHFYYSGKEIFSTNKAVYAIYIHPSIYQPVLIKIPYSVLKTISR